MTLLLFSFFKYVFFRFSRADGRGASYQVSDNVNNDLLSSGLLSLGVRLICWAGTTLSFDRLGLYRLSKLNACPSWDNNIDLSSLEFCCFFKFYWISPVSRHWISQGYVHHIGISWVSSISIRRYNLKVEKISYFESVRILNYQLTKLLDWTLCLILKILKDSFRHEICCK